MCGMEVPWPAVAEDKGNTVSVEKASPTKLTEAS